MSYDYDKAYLKKLAKLLFIYGTDAEDVYVEEFEELKKITKKNLTQLKDFIKNQRIQNWHSQSLKGQAWFTGSIT